MSNYLKVNELFPITNGLFTHIEYDFSMITKAELDIMFIANYGERSTSPLISRLVSGVSPTDEELIKIASILKSYYSNKWDHLKKLYLLEYDPIHNYLDELTETITGEDSGVSSKNSTVTTDMTQDDTRNNTRTDNLSETGTSTSNTTDDNNSEDSVYGFNSVDGVKSDSGTELLKSTESVNGTKTNTGTQTASLVSKNVNKGTVTQGNTSTSSDNKSQTRSSKHSGNIGNLTTQQLFKQELEVRKWNFINTVLEDIKELTTIPIYM